MCLIGDPICNSYSNAYCWLPLVICEKKELADFQIEIKENGDGPVVKDCF